METALTPSQGPVGVSPAQARIAATLARYGQILARYSEEDVAAITTMYVAAKTMLDTGGGSRCAKLLLGLYNGTRFPFHLTDLRCLDGNLYRAAMHVINMDARHTYCEVHVLLNAIYADGRNVGAELETWAYRMRWGQRAKKDQQNFDFGPKWASPQ